ncbi:hypothetical protein [Amycolatopsis samaneae]|uniref:Uncharacterized protein n=1 Tax=Amycolatopsis samaneae TaxID=664691 RepID=A0ABW5GFI7_9PSEU
MVRRLAAALALVALSPFVAEFLLGDQYLSGTPRPGQQLAQFAMFVAFYGSAALLIRETARRLGRGWPTILTLSLAFGLLEEGLLTQSLFNPNYLGIRVLDAGHIPELGIGAPWTVYVLTLHVVWSMGTPIAIVEALFGKEPWLGRLGLAFWSVVFLLGCVAEFLISLLVGPEQFMSHPAQLVVAGLIVAGLVVLAIRGFREPPSTAPAGNAWTGFAIGLVAGTGLQLLERWESVSPWLLAALMLVLVAAAAAVIRALNPPAFSLAAGALLTYCWVGFNTAIGEGTAAIIEQSVLVALAVALLVVTAVRGPICLAGIDLSPADESTVDSREVSSTVD